MGVLSCSRAVATILRTMVPELKTANVWMENDPIPMVSECPAVRIRANGNINATRLSGDCQGGYAQAIWPLDIEVFQFDDGSKYEDWAKIIDITTGRIVVALRANPKLKGLADEPMPGSAVLYSGQKIELKDDPYSVTEEVPSILRHATIKYWITEIIDIP